MNASQHYQIQDLLSEDENGSSFRAKDKVTGRVVVLRRLSTNVNTKRWLNAEEQIAYNIAVDRISKIKHPALRSIVLASFDPTDRAPFIVSQWRETESLCQMIQDGSFPLKLATQVISDALEVCELLSHILDDERIWIETQIKTISLIKTSRGPRFIFWISPRSWLNHQDKAHNFNAIINLVEEIIEYSHVAEKDKDSCHLLIWLNWLKSNDAADASIHEARETLAACAGIEPPLSAKALYQSVAIKPNFLHYLQMGPLQSLSLTKMPLLLILFIMLLLEATAGWVWLQIINNNFSKEMDLLKKPFDKSKFMIPDMNKE